MRRALREAQQAIDDERVAQIDNVEVKEVDLRKVQANSINVLYDPEDEFIGMAAEKVIVRPAMDSGSVANVIHPKELPRGAEPTTEAHAAERYRCPFVHANVSAEPISAFLRSVPADSLGR